MPGFTGMAASADVRHPRITILATGGTIAGEARSPLGQAYHASGVAVAGLIAAAPGIDDIADLDGEQLANVGSQDMDLAIWRTLAARIAAIRADGRAAGIVITHGTDTLEETAFLLDCILPAGMPLVLVGAMRPSNAASADGPANLIEAVRLAADPKARNRGVLVTLNDVVHDARAVRKVQTSGVDAFRSFPGGAVGSASTGRIHFFAPPPPAPWRGAYRLPQSGPLPVVRILYAHADMDKTEIDSLGDPKLAGIVLAGVGNGNAPAAVIAALAAAAARGVPVVRSTRIDDGTVERNVEVDDDRLGFVAAGDLNPQKSRLLLQLLLVAGKRDPATIQRAFDPD